MLAVIPCEHVDEHYIAKNQIRTDSLTHSQTHTRTDRPEYRIPPPPFFNSGGCIKQTGEMARGAVEGPDHKRTLKQLCAHL